MSYFTAHFLRRGSQVVRQGSAKALCVGSIPTLASSTHSETSHYTATTRPLHS